MGTRPLFFKNLVMSVLLMTAFFSTRAIASPLCSSLFNDSQELSAAEKDLFQSYLMIGKKLKDRIDDRNIAERSLIQSYLKVHRTKSPLDRENTNRISLFEFITRYEASVAESSVNYMTINYLVEVSIRRGGPHLELVINEINRITNSVIGPGKESVKRTLRDSVIEFSKMDPYFFDEIDHVWRTFGNAGNNSQGNGGTYTTPSAIEVPSEGYDQYGTPQWGSPFKSDTDGQMYQYYSR